MSKPGSLAAIEATLPAGLDDEERARVLEAFREARVVWYRNGRDDEREGRPEPW